jgi:hypothetical protein
VILAAFNRDACRAVLSLVRRRLGIIAVRSAQPESAGVSGGGGENDCAVRQLGVTPPPERLHQVMAPTS